MEIILAIFLGGLFGFALDRVGANNPNNIIKMLNLTDLRLMRIILGAIGVSSVLLFGGFELGLMDPTHMSVKEAYVGVFVGVGFALSGYCPGTGLTALASGRQDAFFFIIGGFAGAGLYMWSFDYLKDTALFHKILGGKITVGTVENSGYEAVFAGLNGSLMGLILGVVFILLAWKLPAKLRG
jgi:hypothetical protein